jgi:aminoglycoside 3-N-acetyltransferase
MIKWILKKIIPKPLKKRYDVFQQNRALKLLVNFPFNDDNEFLKYYHNILKNDLSISKNDVVLIHSSINKLYLKFPFYKIVNILRELVGENGTILFPTYPKYTSYEFLKRNQIFDVRKTPTITGLLNEFARRFPGSIRSLHPTKSVCSIGPLSQELTSHHQDSPYPYDTCSPYGKIIGKNAKIIGIGVNTSYLSNAHCIDDYLKEKFPVNPYHKKLFESKCINYQGEQVIVKTYAHNMRKMNFNLPKFFNKYVPKDICNDLIINNVPFFIADANLLFDYMLNLAVEDNITIYHKYYYKWSKMI